MKRIIACADHYEALGLLRYKKIDAAFLKKEYRKKVHEENSHHSTLAVCLKS
ncbi:hypothetical protein Hanom_Chr06g00550321 [Helianthus anomalus]